MVVPCSAALPVLPVLPVLPWLPLSPDRSSDAGWVGIAVWSQCESVFLDVLVGSSVILCNSDFGQLNIFYPMVSMSCRMV
jgi:hypothetical protein